MKIGTRTIVPKQEDFPDKWILIDAENKILGRLACNIALLLRGKTNKLFAAHMNTNVKIVVLNSKKIELSGKKNKNKIYYHHTGYPGGIRAIAYDKVLEKKPSFPLRQAVKGMLPKNKLARQLLGNLKIYPDDKHPHIAQKPVKIEL